MKSQGSWPSYLSLYMLLCSTFRTTSKYDRKYTFSLHYTKYLLSSVDPTVIFFLSYCCLPACLFANLLQRGGAQYVAPELVRFIAVDNSNIFLGVKDYLEGTKDACAANKNISSSSSSSSGAAPISSMNPNLNRAHVKGSSSCRPTVILSPSKLSVVLKRGLDVPYELTYVVGTSLTRNPKNPLAGVFTLWEQAGFRTRDLQRDSRTRKENGVDEILHSFLYKSIAQAERGDLIPNQQQQHQQYRQHQPQRVNMLQHTLVIVSGDGNDNDGCTNFVEIAHHAACKGMRVEVWAWRRNCSYRFMQLAGEAAVEQRVRIVFLDDYAAEIFDEYDNTLSYFSDTDGAISRGGVRQGGQGGRSHKERGGDNGGGSGSGGGYTSDASNHSSSSRRNQRRNRRRKNGRQQIGTGGGVDRSEQEDKSDVEFDVDTDLDVDANVDTADRYAAGGGRRLARLPELEGVELELHGHRKMPAQYSQQTSAQQQQHQQHKHSRDAEFPQQRPQQGPQRGRFGHPPFKRHKNIESDDNNDEKCGNSGGGGGGGDRGGDGGGDRGGDGGGITHDSQSSAHPPAATTTTTCAKIATTTGVGIGAHSIPIDLTGTDDVVEEPLVDLSPAFTCQASISKSKETKSEPPPQSLSTFSAAVTARHSQQPPQQQQKIIVIDSDSDDLMGEERKSVQYDRGVATPRCELAVNASKGSAESAVPLPHLGIKAGGGALIGEAGTRMAVSFVEGVLSSALGAHAAAHSGVAFEKASDIENSTFNSHSKRKSSSSSKPNEIFVLKPSAQDDDEEYDEGYDMEEDDEDEKNEEDKCMSCLHRARCAISHPCGHICFCSRCEPSQPLCAYCGDAIDHASLM